MIQTKLEAVQEIIWDASNKRSSRASLKRLRKAMRTLGLTMNEQEDLEKRLDYRKYSAPYPLYEKFQGK